MTGKSLSHSFGSHIIAHQQASTPKNPTPESPENQAKTSANKVDDLLRAFSDVAYTSEEVDLPWESWNYSRISAF